MIGTGECWMEAFQARVEESVDQDQESSGGKLGCGGSSNVSEISQIDEQNPYSKGRELPRADADVITRSTRPMIRNTWRNKD